MKMTVLIAAVLLIVSCSEQKETRQNSADTENKEAATQAPAYDPALDIIKVAPTLYKLLSDTMNIRVLEATYKPGDSSAVHAHPDFALYVLEGGKVRITAKDGASREVEFKKGAGMVLPSDTHSAKNIGNTTLRLVVVEVNRPKGEANQ